MSKLFEIKKINLDLVRKIIVVLKESYKNLVILKFLLVLVENVMILKFKFSDVKKVFCIVFSFFDRYLFMFCVLLCLVL